MKRRFKILAALTSLCLALALMAYGVYAATSSSLQVTSSVSFESQLNVLWKAKVEGGELLDEDDDNKTGAVAGVHSWSQEVDPTDESANLQWNGENGQEDPSIAFTAAHKVITYTFECENKGLEALLVTIEQTALFSDDNLKVTYKVNNGDEVESKELLAVQEEVFKK